MAFEAETAADLRGFLRSIHSDAARLHKSREWHLLEEADIINIADNVELMLDVLAGVAPKRLHKIADGIRRRQSEHRARELAGELRALRLAAGISQLEVARHMGYSNQRIGQIERGTPPDILDRYQAALAEIIGDRHVPFEFDGRKLTYGSGAIYDFGSYTT
jgi:DNA-binding XRE family transcriptional regulator